MTIWNSTLADFRDRVTAAPVPAAVSVAAVTATLGLSLLIKVLQITRRKKTIERLDALIEAARRESAILARCADEDIEEFSGNEVPLRAARSIIAGLGLCAEAAPMVTGAIAADLDSAAMLLAAAARAILRCVRSNSGSDEECLSLEKHLLEHKTF